ncbi:hypothetical protein ACFQL4_21660 [Halosimplex aquaticum]
MPRTGSPLDRLRRPEYTGENRCLPCTILNVAIASVGTTLLVAWLTAAGYPTVALWGNSRPRPLAGGHLVARVPRPRDADADETLPPRVRPRGVR